MKPLFRSFNMFIRQIQSDKMLIAVCFAPILAAFFFRFGVPYAETLLCEHLGKASVLADYYILFDLFLGIMVPYLFCFASTMVMLTEHDENMTRFLAVTPVGKRGYIISRLVFPAVISFFASLFINSLFTLTAWPPFLLITVSALNCALCVSVSLFVFVFSHNRVEGMAAAKLSGLIMLGLPVPFFIGSDIKYLFSALPSFWISMLSCEKNYFFLLPAVLTSAAWAVLLYGKFKRKLV